MKNICFFTSDMSWSGGTNKCTAMIANALSVYEKKYLVHVLDLHNDGDLMMYKLSNDIIYHSLNSQNMIDTVVRLRRYITKHNIDVLINVENFMGIYSMPALFLKKTKNIIWEHGNYYLKRYSKVDMVRWIEFKLCDNYITLTEDDINEFTSRFSGRCNIRYIYNACETLGEYREYDPNKKSIITVGMNRYDKGFDILAEVASKVKEKHPDWKWNVYGSMDVDEKMNEIVYGKIKKYNLNDFLVFHGVKTDMLSYYTDSSIMVMTSRREGLPMVLLEARGMGLPMIAFDIKTGPKEIVDDDINGYLIEPYDIDAMADKINILIEDIELRKKLSLGTQRGIEKFSIDRIIRKWDDLLEEI